MCGGSVACSGFQTWITTKSKCEGDYHGLDKYKWQIGMSFLWNVMLYVLIEVRHRQTGPEVDRSWNLIRKVLSHCPQVFEISPRAVHRALGLQEPLTPNYIRAIRRCRKLALEPASGTLGIGCGATAGAENPFGYSAVQTGREDGNFPAFEHFASHDFSNLLSFEMDSNE
ncbi:hypothetical protein BBP40_000567 [Aspergillus hancockii]|nr:hypothetical protein BBP40_000567 [Aspergillus hancockii]